MSDFPLVSIIIPVYNGSNYLGEALDSALAQTYQNVEILVINDGSTDNGATREIALRYGDKIRYYEKENGGVATALNLGIREMKGAYFSWLSHDDVYYPEKISAQIALKNKLPDNTIFYTNIEYINKKSRHLSFYIMDSNYLNSKPSYSILRGSIHGCSLLIPKSAFNECGVFDENLKTTQDYDLWFKMRLKYKFVHQPRVLIKSRIHKNQGSNNNSIVLKECNELWMNFINQITLAEIIQYEKNANLYYAKLGIFLMKTPYKEAASYCFTKVKHKQFYKVLQKILWGFEMIGNKYRNMIYSVKKHLPETV